MVTRLFRTAATTTVATPAPVYITIDPPCYGKTEVLRSQLLEEGYNPENVFSRDVALDEQSSLYHRIPLAAILFPTSHLEQSKASQLLQSGPTVYDRLLDPSYDKTDAELRNAILWVAGRMTPQDLGSTLYNKQRKLDIPFPFLREENVQSHMT